MTLSAARTRTDAGGVDDEGGAKTREEDEDDPCVVERVDVVDHEVIGKQAPGVDGAASGRGPGVPGADGEKGAGGGKHPGLARRHPDAIAQRTLFLATSSVVASAASYTRGMPEPRFQWPASSITSSGKFSWRIVVV